MISEENEYATISNDYLMKLEKIAKDCEYYRGRVDGLEYVIDSIQESIRLKERDK